MDDLYNDNWFIELVAFLVYATNIDYQRPIVVHLVQGQNGDTNIDTSELEAMLRLVYRYILSIYYFYFYVNICSV